MIHDVDFNPEIDRQAEDRAHRIGQTKPVDVYRLVAEGTVDRDILDLAARNEHYHAIEQASRRWRGGRAMIQRERAVKF